MRRQTKSPGRAANMKPRVLALLAIFILTLSLPVACTSTPADTTSTTPMPTSYTLSQLKYRLLAAYPDYFWCDPDSYPVARPGAEQQKAIDQFAAISADHEEFSAILVRLNLANKTGFTDDEKLQVYREHKKLQGAVQVTPAAAGYTFTIRTGQNQGKVYEGTVSTLGAVKVTDEAASFNTCPICLAAGTLIDTPDGLIPVEELQAEMVIYTVDGAGNKIKGVISAKASVPAPLSFKITTIALSDGRTVTASPGHPAADGRVMGDLEVGDVLDGGTVVAVTSGLYTGSTYDILPNGGTGLYWANGILLKSTLVR
jgi:hypothetical protein